MPRFYQVTPVVLGRRRATRPASQTQQSTGRESARRQPEDLPDGSDVTDRRETQVLTEGEKEGREASTAETCFSRNAVVSLGRPQTTACVGSGSRL